MSLSVYSSLFNYSPAKFDLRGALSNWFKYADEVVIATFPDQKEELEKVCFKHGDLGLINLVTCDTSLKDPLFDGKLKNASLKSCSNDVVIQQDMDERIGGRPDVWAKLASLLLEQGSACSCMVSVIDLFGDLDHYKGINRKWYIHTKKGTNRGVVNFAKRSDGTVDTDKSDSCELIGDDGNLIMSFLVNGFEENLDTNFPHVIHLGYLDLEKRAEHNKFRKTCWEMMQGKEVQVALTVDELMTENSFQPHGLKAGWWE